MAPDTVVEAKIDPVALMFAMLWRSLAELITSEPPTFRMFACAVAPETIVVALTVVDAKIDPVALILPTL